MKRTIGNSVRIEVKTDEAVSTAGVRNVAIKKLCLSGVSGPEVARCILLIPIIIQRNKCVSSFIPPMSRPSLTYPNS